MRPEAHAFDRLVEWAMRLFLCLFVLSMPGSSARSILYERVAPPLPDSLRDRDARVDALIETPDHAPIAKARIRALAVLDDGVHLAGESMTDSHGHASLASLPHGATWIIADAPGRARGSTMLALEAGSRAVTLTLDIEHTLDVEVKDDHGAALAEAEIEVTAGDPLPVGARTQANGVAHVRRLGAGPFIHFPTNIQVPRPGGRE